MARGPVGLLAGPCRGVAPTPTEGQHSLWPSFAAVPVGWTVVHGEETRQSYLDHVETHWTDLRPLSLVAQREGAGPESIRPCSVPARSVGSH
ncbi:MbtH family protein [Parafrankia elaeagni]|uniref:MbtH family protein n=1 Tax=Parafrankia elaeagni TaxID=222534 RepID=UPI000A016708|nr:MbtH family NRPS accessory protein [Parafrankia elaeagni]